MRTDHLKTYLNDHFAGSVAGLGLAERCLATNTEGPLAEVLAGLVSDIKEEQGVVVTLLERLDGGVNPLKAAAARLGEKAGRVKLNNRLAGYSDLSRLEELEGLVMGVRSKLALWTALVAAVGADPRFVGIDFGKLIRRGEGQLEQLERYRLAAARRAFAPSDPTSH